MIKTGRHGHYASAYSTYKVIEALARFDVDPQHNLSGREHLGFMLLHVLSASGYFPKSLLLEKYSFWLALALTPIPKLSLSTTLQHRTTGSKTTLA
jgi:hypothetical protein